MTDRRAQISALIDARTEVQNKLDTFYAEESAKLLTTLKHLCRIDGEKTGQLLADLVQSESVGAQLPTATTGIDDGEQAVEASVGGSATWDELLKEQQLHQREEPGNVA